MSQRNGWELTAEGVPLIDSWEQLTGDIALPERIVWAKDRKVMVLVAAGSFVMGTTEDAARQMVEEYGWSLPWAMAETPQRSVSLPAFYLDLSPVTHADYAHFLADNLSYPVPAVSESGAEPYNWDRRTRRPPEALMNHPVVLVSWEDAQAYCCWVGKKLPSEACWEKGARGEDGRLYPWGDIWDSTLLNCAERYSDVALSTVSQWQSWWNDNEERLFRSARTTKVGQFQMGASPYGLLDMAGNVWEWCADWYDAYPGSQAEHDNFGQQFRVLRGGSWYGTRRNVRCAFRLRNPADSRMNNVGFRCASRPL